MGSLRNLEWNKGGENKFSLGYTNKEKYTTCREREAWSSGEKAWEKQGSSR